MKRYRYLGDKLTDRALVNATCTAVCACGCGQATRISGHNDTAKGWVKGQPLRFVRGHNARGELNNSWSGGRYIHGSGYVAVWVLGNPRAVDGYVFEHVVVVEEALGHALDEKHPVHHVDEDKQNNANSNLVACENQAYHMLLHQRQRALDACGDANALKCAFCKKYDSPTTITSRPDGRGGEGRTHYHRTCRADYERARRAKRLVES